MSIFEFFVQNLLRPLTARFGHLHLPQGWHDAFGFELHLTHHQVYVHVFAYICVRKHVCVPVCVCPLKSQAPT